MVDSQKLLFTKDDGVVSLSDKAKALFDKDGIHLDPQIVGRDIGSIVKEDMATYEDVEKYGWIKAQVLFNLENKLTLSKYAKSQDDRFKLVESYWNNISKLPLFSRMSDADKAYILIKINYESESPEEFLSSYLKLIANEEISDNYIALMDILINEGEKDYQKITRAFKKLYDEVEAINKANKENFDPISYIDKVLKEIKKGKDFKMCYQEEVDCWQPNCDGHGWGGHSSFIYIS